jgi:hypothetical protein
MAFAFTHGLRALSVLAILAATPRAFAMEPPPEGASYQEILAYENRLRPFTVLGDATAIINAHFAIEGQFVPWMHHAIRLAPFCALGDTHLWFVTEAADDRIELSCGAEIGYRYYTGERGANGFFVGPSLILAHTHIEAGTDSANTPVGPVDYVYGGPALDVGVQGITEQGFTVGGGAGAALLRHFESGSHFRVDSRIFVNVGYSFP